MKLIAQKPCSFGGKKFYIGDDIPVECVLNPQSQAKMGVLAIVTENEAVAAPADIGNNSTGITVVIHAEEGDLPLNLSQEGLQAVVDILTCKVNEAEAIVQEMTDGDALILLDIADNRKSIKEAAKARAQVLNVEESEGEQ